MKIIRVFNIKKSVILLLLPLSIYQCSPTTSTNDQLVTDSLKIEIDSSSGMSGTDESKEESITEEEQDMDELNYVVVVAEGYNYDSLKSIAIRSSVYLNFKFDTLDRYYNTIKKRIVLPDTSSDEVWAGEYPFRRYGEDMVSLEMMNAYIDTLIIKDEKKRQVFYQDSTKMFVLAALYPEKNRADSLAKVLRPHFPMTRIIPSNIYMGCMH